MGYTVVRISQNLPKPSITSYSRFAEAKAAVDDMRGRDIYWMDKLFHLRIRTHGYRIGNSSGQFAKVRIIKTA